MAEPPSTRIAPAKTMLSVIALSIVIVMNSGWRWRLRSRIRRNLCRSASRYGFEAAEGGRVKTCLGTRLRGGPRAIRRFFSRGEKRESRNRGFLKSIMENAEDWAPIRSRGGLYRSFRLLASRSARPRLSDRATSGGDRADDQTIRTSIRPAYCPAVTWRSSGLSLATALRMTSAAMNPTSSMQP
ncbi:hypothetical protein ACVJMZ_003794 [Sinorhizobium medicae]